MKELDMMENLIENLLNLSPVEFVEEYNRQCDANFIVDDIDWHDNRIDYSLK